jgi:hypothetical protein
MIIKDYLLELYKMNLGEHQKAYYLFLIQNGKTYFPNQSLEQIQEKIGYVSPELKSCYKNSILCNIYDRSLSYVEGYYVFNDLPLPLEHAWNIQDKLIIDSTALVLNEMPKEYYGIEIPNKIVREYLKTNQLLTLLQFYFNKTYKHAKV